MSETQARQTQSSRGRSSARGSRGGHGGTARGGPRTSNKPTNTETKATNDNDMLADQGELGEMKKRYSSQLNTLKELFPDWTEVDLVLALEETDGDLQSTIERISEGKAGSLGLLPPCRLNVYLQAMCRNSRRLRKSPEIGPDPK